MTLFSRIVPNRARHYAVHRWLMISSCATVLCLLCLAFYSVPEYLVSRTLDAQQKELQLFALQTHKNANMASLQLMIAKVESRRKKTCAPLALLQQVKKLCHDDTSLESLTIKPHDMQITLAAKNAPGLVSIAGTLAEHPLCNGLHITSLEPREQRLLATMKGNNFNS